MSKQIIFCVETNGKARTDIVYIKDTIRKFYNDYSGINFEYVPMGTKTAFNNKKTKADIRKYIKNNLIIHLTQVLNTFSTDSTCSHK